MATYLKQLKEASQQGKLVLLVGSNFKQQKFQRDIINKFLEELESSWDILEHYIPKIKDRELPVEAFFRIFYQYLGQEVFAVLDCLKYQETDSFYHALAKIVKEEKVLALGTTNIDNKLPLALEGIREIPFEKVEDDFPYVSYLNGTIHDTKSLENTLELDGQNLLASSLHLEKFFNFFSYSQAKSLLVLGVAPDEYCWKKTYGFILQLIKKHKDKHVFWVCDTEYAQLKHLKSLGNITLIPYSSDIIKNVFDVDHDDNFTPANLGKFNEWLDKKNGQMEILEFAAALLNYLVSRAHSLKILDYVLDHYQDNNNTSGIARVERLMAQIFFEQGRLEKSIHTHNEAISNWGKSQNQSQTAKEHILLGNTYWNAGATDKAVQHYGEALSIYNLLEDINGISNVTDKLARICDIDEDYELAHRYYSESLEAKKKKHLYSEIIQTLLNLSATLIKNQEWNEAIKYLEEALKINDSYYCFAYTEEIYQHLGLVYMSIADFENAHANYKKAYDIYFTRQDSLSSTFVNCNLGHICAKLENYDDSVKYYEGALESYEKMGDWQHLAAIYNNLGYINTCRKECSLAEEYFSRSVEIFVALGDVMNLIRTHGNLARVYTMQGEFENAIECYLANIEMLSQLGEQADLASTLIAMAIAQMQCHRKEESEKSLAQAKSIYQSLGMEKEKEETDEILRNLQLTSN